MMMAPTNCDLSTGAPPWPFPGPVRRRGRRNSCNHEVMAVIIHYPCLYKLLAAVTSQLLQVEGYYDHSVLGDAVRLLQSPGQLQQRGHTL